MNFGEMNKNKKDGCNSQVNLKIRFKICLSKLKNLDKSIFLKFKGAKVCLNLI